MDRREMQRGTRQDNHGRSNNYGMNRNRRPSPKEMERAREERMRRRAEIDRRRRAEIDHRRRAEIDRRRMAEQRRNDNEIPRRADPVESQVPDKQPVRQPSPPLEERSKEHESIESKEVQHEPNLPKKRKLPLRYVKFIIGALIAIAIIVSLSLTVLFPVKVIIVEGESQYNAAEIISASAIKKDADNLFLCGRGSAELIKKELPYINYVSIQKKLLNTVVIHVKDTEPAYCMQCDNAWYLLDADDKLLEISKIRPRNLLVVKGMLIDKAEVGENAVFFETPKLRAIKEIYQIISENNIEGITIVDLEDSLNVKMQYMDRFIIKLGLPNEMDDKIRYAMTVIRERLGPDEKGTLDVSNGKNVQFNPSEYLPFR